MIDETLTTKLKTLTPKVYPGKAPESAKGSFVVYMRSGSQRETYLSGPSGITYPEFQLDVYSDKYSTTALLSDQIVTALDGWVEGGVMYCSIENDFDAAPDADEDGFYRHVILIRITYQA